MLGRAIGQARWKIGTVIDPVSQTPKREPNTDPSFENPYPDQPDPTGSVPQTSIGFNLGRGRG